MPSMEAFERLEMATTGDEAASSRIDRRDADEEIGRALREVRDLGSRLADLKGICRAPLYSGRPAEFSEWKFRLKNFASLLELDEGLAWCEQHSLQDLERLQFTAVDRARDKLLYSLLVQICSGRALAIVRRAGGSFGLKSWLLLLQEYEPKIATRLASVLAGLLTPHWNSAEPWYQQLIDWERQVETYEEAAGERFSDALKCAIVQRYAPSAVKQFLRIVPDDMATSYAKLRNSLDLFYAKARQFDTQGSLSCDYPEVDAVAKGGWKGAGKGRKGAGKGKGGSKVKGKGKGKQQQQHTQQQQSKQQHWQSDSQPQQKQWVSNKMQQPQQKQQQQQSPFGGKGAGKSGKGSQQQQGKKKEKFDGNCFNCGKFGHRSADCWHLLNIDAEEEEHYEQTAVEHGDQDDAEFWQQFQEQNLLLTVMALDTLNKTNRKRILQYPDAVWMLVDSGAYGSVCPAGFADHVPIKRVGSLGPVTGADGKPLQFKGTKPVQLRFWHGTSLCVEFDVFNVVRPILAVSTLRKAGFAVHFDQNPRINYGKKSTPMLEIGNLFYVPMKFHEGSEPQGWVTTEAASFCNALKPVAVSPKHVSTATASKADIQGLPLTLTPVQQYRQDQQRANEYWEQRSALLDFVAWCSFHGRASNEPTAISDFLEEGTQNCLCMQQELQTN